MRRGLRRGGKKGVWVKRSAGGLREGLAGVVEGVKAYVADGFGRPSLQWCGWTVWGRAATRENAPASEGDRYKVAAGGRLRSRGIVEEGSGGGDGTGTD